MRWSPATSSISTAARSATIRVSRISPSGSARALASQPAFLRAADGGYEIELVAGEEGVSPGQACVFYDAPSGQARVLGGGFIKSATASNTRARETAPPLEAMRG